MHRPGTLRALLTILKDTCHIICPPCERYAALSAEREYLNRSADPCPFVCSQCSARADIVMDVPRGFVLTTPAPRQRKRTAIRTDPLEPLGPSHTPKLQDYRSVRWVPLSR